MLDVPEDIANTIYTRAGVAPSDCDRASGFWYCVWKHDVPIIVTEGAKKAASIVSQGHAAIGLPGINGGYQTSDAQKNPIPVQLREEFAMFATPGRDIKFCFDHDTKPTTIVNVHKALLQTGILLQQALANVSVISLPGPDKGADDFIVNNGSEQFQALIDQAQSLEEWYKNNPPPDLRFLIKLKNGQVLNLYEKQASGTVTANPANLTPEQITQAIPQLLKPPFAQSPTEGIEQREQGQPSKKAENVQSSPLTLQLSNTPNSNPVQSLTNNQKYWASQQKVPNYALNIPRKFLIEKENKDIALTAKQLLDNYAVELDDGSTVYRGEAFSVRKFRDTYSIHRANDEGNSYFANPLMQFEVDKKGKAVITKKPEQMLMVERQEFLKVNDNLKSTSQLPSFYEDAITLKSQLGSLAPLGTQTVIKRLEITEVSQLLSYSLKTAQSKHLQIGDYRIKAEINQSNGEGFVKLFKKEKDGLDRQAVKVNVKTNEAIAMQVSQQDIENLRLIAKRVQLEYGHQDQEIPNAISTPSQNSAVKTTPQNGSTKTKYSPPNPEYQENKRGYMGLAIKALINHYGTVQADGSMVYKSLAYTFVSQKGLNSNSLLVYRPDPNQGQNQELIVRIDNYQSEAHPGTLKAWGISAAEKASFIQLADSLKKGLELPSADAELQSIRAVLGNFSPWQNTQYRPPKRQNNKSSSFDIEL